MTKKSKAFTLTELIVVLSVISILIAMVAGSSSMIRMTKLVNARSITSESPVKKIDGLVVWYETVSKDSFEENETLDGSNITKWYDVNPPSIIKKFNTLIRTASNAVTYKKNGINNLPSISFDGSVNANLKLSQFKKGSVDRSTIFFVISFNIHDNKTFFDSFAGNAAVHSADPDQLYLRGSGTGVWTSTQANIPNILTNKGHIICSYLDNANSKFYFNNATDFVGNSTINPGNTDFSGLNIGSRNDGQFAFSGLYSELIIFDRPLKKNERKAVMAYLSQKYRIKVKNLDG